MQLFVKVVRVALRLLLAAFMFVAGSGHFTNTQSFLAQVPPFLPARVFIVQASGVVELAIALALVLAGRWLPVVGLLLAGFYVLVFPGNISQYLTHSAAFGLNSDGSRLIRLFFQPVLIVWALWCTDGWRRRHESWATIRGWFGR